MHRPRSRRLTIATLAPLAAMAALSGCGDAGDDDVDAAVDQAEATASSVIEEGAVDTDGAEDELPNVAESSADQLRDAVGDDDLATLFQVLDAAGFDDIAEAERFTFFAPNDGAFAAIDADLLAELLADPEGLRDILQDHLLDDIVVASDLTDGATVTSNGGLELTFDLSGDQPTVNGIPIVRTDVSVDDRGVVHVIDGLLLDE